MKVLLAYILFAFFMAIWSVNRSRPSRAWALALVTLATSVLYLSPRVL